MIFALVENRIVGKQDGLDASSRLFSDKRENASNADVDPVLLNLKRDARLESVQERDRDSVRVLRKGRQRSAIAFAAWSAARRRGVGVAGSEARERTRRRLQSCAAAIRRHPTRTAEKKPSKLLFVHFATAERETRGGRQTVSRTTIARRTRRPI